GNVCNASESYISSLPLCTTLTAILRRQPAPDTGLRGSDISPVFGLPSSVFPLSESEFSEL
ncbi:MAG: hypothetical protein KDC80_21970, partial [Saprospiraceae bacterium]|nr:hypothetical protein [Saprospiraceae bacterium]